MAKWDVFDEGVIDAEPSEVFKALMDEYAGKSKWWMPYVESKPRENGQTIEEGSIFDATVRYKGTVRFTGRITKVSESRLIAYDYIGGDLLGTGEWTLVPSDGKTIVKFRWQTKPHGLMTTLVSLFISFPKGHSAVMQLGFKGLDSHVKKK